MAYSLKEQLNKKPRLASGHRLCAGCGAGVAINSVLRALDEGDRAVVSNATSCLEVSTFIYPNTAYEDSYIHSAFENAAAMTGGVQTAYKALKKRGKIDEDFKFICFGGDGGTYDIGLQSLSGAMERGHDMVYVCYDNEAYMNTGIQRSSSTPRFANTTTSPVGTESYGKNQDKKDLTAIIAAHNIPYVAQTTMYTDMRDLYAKAHKAIYTEGPCFLNVLAPCPRGWRYDASDLAEICKRMEEISYDKFRIFEAYYRFAPKNIETIMSRDSIFLVILKPGLPRRCFFTILHKNSFLLTIIS